MKLDCTHNGAVAPRPSRNRTSQIGRSIGQHPVLYATDAVDIGAATFNALGGAATSLGKASGLGLGTVHLTAGLYFLTEALTEDCSAIAKYYAINTASELLVGTGHICAATGSGLASLALVGVGAAIRHANGMSEQGQLDSMTWGF